MRTWRKVEFVGTAVRLAESTHVGRVKANEQPVGALYSWWELVPDLGPTHSGPGLTADDDLGMDGHAYPLADGTDPIGADGDHMFVVVDGAGMEAVVDDEWWEKGADVRDLA